MLELRLPALMGPAQPAAAADLLKQTNILKTLQAAIGPSPSAHTSLHCAHLQPASLSRDQPDGDPGAKLGIKQKPLPLRRR